MHIRRKLPNSIFMYVAIIVFSALTLAVIAMNGEISQKDVGTTLLALLGTFLGATFAFRLNEDKETRAALSLNRAALNRSLLVLLRQYNAIYQLHSAMEKYDSPIKKAFNMPAYQPPAYDDLVHHFNDLEFLIESEPNMLLLLTVEQERFYQALESLKVRNVFYIHEVQPEIARLGLNGRKVPSVQIASLLGERLFCGAMSGANEAYLQVFESVESIKEMHAQLLRCAKKLFPGYKFVTFEMNA